METFWKGKKNTKQILVILLDLKQEESVSDKNVSFFNVYKYLVSSVYNFTFCIGSK